MKVVACGASGLIGKSLTEMLAQKYELVCLRRKLAPAQSDYSVREVLWNPPYLADGWVKEIDGAYAVINLSGEPIVAKRWTAKQKSILRTSRLNTTKAIVSSISQVKTKPKVLINASAVGYYGSSGDVFLNEMSPAGQDYLSELCGEWESEALKAKMFGVRVVLLRTGIVLSGKGGALSKMLPPFKMGIGGPLGNGRQFMSWIHIDDEVNAILKTLEDVSIEGPVNLTSPQPATMKEFAKTLGEILRRPSAFPVPGVVLKIILGEMSDMLLTGQKVMPDVLSKSGFRFKYPVLKDALKDLLSTK